MLVVLCGPPALSAIAPSSAPSAALHGHSAQALPSPLSLVAAEPLLGHALRRPLATRRLRAALFIYAHDLDAFGFEHRVRELFAGDGGGGSDSTSLGGRAGACRTTGSVAPVLQEAASPTPLRFVACKFEPRSPLEMALLGVLRDEEDGMYMESNTTDTQVSHTACAARAHGASVRGADGPDGPPLVFAHAESVYCEALAEAADAASAAGAAFIGFDDAARGTIPGVGGIGVGDNAGADTGQVFLRMTSPPGAGDGAIVASLVATQLACGQCSDSSAVPASGVFGFATRAQFVQYARAALRAGPGAYGEPCVASAAALALAAGERVLALRVPRVRADSSARVAALAAALDPILSGAATMALPGLPNVPGEPALPAPRRLRVCFDLDHALLAPPNVPGDFSTCRANPAMLALAAAADARGHAVVIATSRGMAARGGAAATALADSGRDVLRALDDLGVPVAELVAGGPHADVFVDARSLNPLLRSPAAFGLSFGAPPAAGDVPNKLPNNKYNRVELMGSRVVKTGPFKFMRGEIFFYEQLRLPALLGIRELFPRYLGHKHLLPPLPLSPHSALVPLSGPLPCEPLEPLVALSLEVVRGVPLTTLFAHAMLEDYHLGLLLDALARLHGCVAARALPIAGVSSGAGAAACSAGNAELGDHLLAKMRERFGAPGQFSESEFARPRAVLDAVAAGAEAFVARGGVRAAPVVHGDPWFANVLLTAANEVKLLDMRGLVGGREALGGDAVYDLAKVAQSLLGFDEAVFALQPVAHNYRLTLVRAFVVRVRARAQAEAEAAGASMGAGLADTGVARDVFAVALCLMAGAMHAYEAPATRQALWRLVSSLAVPERGSEAADIVAAFE